MKWNCYLLSVLALVDSGSSLSSTSFYASEVSYCPTSSTRRAIQVQAVELEFDYVEKTIFFNLTASSIAPALAASLVLNLTAYGMELRGVRIDLCSIANSALCPLPQYSFNGFATIPIPSEISESIQIPEIAKRIPDLEAKATLKLIDNQTGEEATCLSIKLSNGLTTKYSFVSWTLGGIIFLSFFFSVFGVMIDYYHKKECFHRRSETLLQIFAWYQFCASTGLLSLSYPLVLTSFTSNFSAFQGLIFNLSEQESFRTTVRNTGGHEPSRNSSLVGGALALAINSASPFNFTPNSTNGIAHYTSTLLIAPSNAFLTVLITFLIFISISIALLLCFTFGLFIFSKIKRSKVTDSTFDKITITRLVEANAVRVLLISYFPILIFSFFEWNSRSGSWLPSFLAAVTSILLTLILIYLGVFIGRNDSVNLKLGQFVPLLNPYHEKYAIIPFLMIPVTFIRALFIAISQSNGAQSIELLVLETLVLLGLLVTRPFHNRSSNGVYITIQSLRTIISGLLIAFIPSMNLNAITAVIIGFVVIVIEGLVVIGFFILVVLDGISIILRLFKGLREESPSSSEIDVLEKMEDAERARKKSKV